MRLLFGLSKSDGSAPVEVAGAFPNKWPWLSGAAISTIGLGLIGFAFVSGHFGIGAIAQAGFGIILTAIGAAFIGVFRSVRQMTSLEQVAAAYDVDVETARQTLLDAGVHPKVLVNGKAYYKVEIGRDPAQLLRPTDPSNQLLRPSTSASSDALLRPLPQENLSTQEQTT